MRRAWAWVLAGIGLAAAGCTSSQGGDGHETKLSVQGLRGAHSTCPLPLAAAAKDAGHATTSEPTAAPQSAPASDSVLKQIDGTSVQCSARTRGGQLTVFLIASTKKHAAGPALLPLLSYRDELHTSQLSSIANRIPKTESGDLVRIDAGNGQAALGIVTVGGARSAAFVLYGEGTSPDVVRKTAERLADRLD